MIDRADSQVKIFVQPDVRRRRLTIRVDAADGVEVELTLAEGPPSTVSGAGEVRLDFAEFDLWSPGQPALSTLSYRARIQGAAGESGTIRFGMRECTVKDNWISLNQSRLYLQGLDFEAQPEGADVDSIREQLARVQASGFNAVRVRACAATRPLLDAADALGVLVFVVLPAEADGPELSAEISGLLNNPSLVAWVLEGGPPERCTELRKTDRSRLIFYEESRESPIETGSFFVRPYREDREPYDDCRVAFSAPLTQRAESYLRHLGEPDELSLATVLRAEDTWDLRAADGPTPVQSIGGDSISGAHLEDLALARELVASSLRLQVDALRSNARLSGYFINGYTKRGEEKTEAASGLEYGGETLASAQASVHPVIHLSSRNLATREEIPVAVTFVNDARLEGRADLSLQIVGPTLQVLWKKKRGVKIPRGGSELWSGSISASGSTGAHRFVVRIMKDMKHVAESSETFYVFERVTPWEGDIHVLDPGKRWSARCASLAKPSALHAPIHIVPPIANTIRGYPENDLALILGQVREGAVAIFFEPPSDWNDLAEVVDPELSVQSGDMLGLGEAAFHVARLHPVFDGLPAGKAMGWPYRELLPRRTLLEFGEEDICRTFTGPMEGPGDATEIGSGILVRKYGSGRIVFTHLRILDALGNNPVADRLFVNLLKHFSRRSVQSGGAFPVHQRTVEWLRKQRTETARRWMTIGMFSNAAGCGHETEYAPEQSVAFDETYPGWYSAVVWRPWTTLARDGYWLDLEEATGGVNVSEPPRGTGTGYAYAEFQSEHRQETELRFTGTGAVKIWLSGKLVFSSGFPLNPGKRSETVDVLLRQGKNTLLVKQSLRKCAPGFSLEISPETEAATVRWWA